MVTIRVLGMVGLMGLELAGCLPRQDDASLGGSAGESGRPGDLVDPADSSGGRRGSNSSGCSFEGTGGSEGLSGSLAVHIHDIQGCAHRSPLEGKEVSRVGGVVTAVTPSGFYFQSAERDTDGDDATSEGLFVFTSNRPSVLAGDLVLVTGRVSEYRPGCPDCDPSSSAYANLSTTEIEQPRIIEVLEAGVELPTATRLGPGGRIAPGVVSRAEPEGDVEEEGAPFEPERDAIAFYESLEGMRVEVLDPVAVGPTNDYGELAVLAQGDSNTGLRTARGGIAVAADDANPERLILEHPAMPRLSVGDSFTGSVSAVVGYDYGAYKLSVTGSLPASIGGGIRREVTTLAERFSDELTLATLNVENLDPSDGAAKFGELAAVIVTHLGSPDVLALAEVQDDSGPIDDGTVGAASTLALLEAAIAEEGGPRYQHCGIDPSDGADGGQPGGNIRVALLFRTDRGLSLTERPGANALIANEVVSLSGSAGLRYSPGRIEPLSLAFAESRKPFAAEFRFEGETLLVIATHFCSKLADEPLFGRFQPPAERSAEQRLRQASVVAGFVTQLLAVEPGARVAVLGDLNDFEFSPPALALDEAGTTPLVLRLPPQERYTYVYQGNSQSLDHILVSPFLLERVTGVDVVHVGAEFAERVSDHDPMVARFTMGAEPPEG